MSVLIPIDKLRPDPQNPRRAGVGDVSEMAESMASVGVLQPLLVSPDPEVADGYLVVFGHRRLAGAIAAKLTEVPAEVRELDPVDRLAIQLIENMQRAEIDALDEALAFKTLLDLGLSQRAVGERVGRAQSHISKRLSLLRLPAEARKALDSGGITISDAFQLTRLKEAGRVRTALKNGRQWGDVGRAVDAQLREADEAAKHAAAVKEFTAKGVKVIEVKDYWHSYGRKERALGNGYDQLHVKPEVHAKQSCHAAVVDGQGRVTLVCTRPDRHPEWKARGNGRGPLTDDEKAKRALKRAHNKDRRTAEQARGEAMTKLLQKRLPKPVLFEHLVLQGLNAASLPPAGWRARCWGSSRPSASPGGGPTTTPPRWPPTPPRGPSNWSASAWASCSAQPSPSCARTGRSGRRRPPVGASPSWRRRATWCRRRSSSSSTARPRGRRARRHRPHDRPRPPLRGAGAHRGRLRGRGGPRRRGPCAQPGAPGALDGALPGPAGPARARRAPAVGGRPSRGDVGGGDARLPPPA